MAQSIILRVFFTFIIISELKTAAEVAQADGLNQFSELSSTAVLARTVRTAALATTMQLTLELTRVDRKYLIDPLVVRHPTHDDALTTLHTPNSHCRVIADLDRRSAARLV